MEVWQSSPTVKQAQLGFRWDLVFKVNQFTVQARRWARANTSTLIWKDDFRFWALAQGCEIAEGDIRFFFFNSFYKCIHLDRVDSTKELFLLRMLVLTLSPIGPCEFYLKLVFLILTIGGIFTMIFGLVALKFDKFEQWSLQKLVQTLDTYLAFFLSFELAYNAIMLASTAVSSLHIVNLVSVLMACPLSFKIVHLASTRSLNGYCWDLTAFDGSAHHCWGSSYIMLSTGDKRFVIWTTEGWGRRPPSNPWHLETCSYHWQALRR